MMPSTQDHAGTLPISSRQRQYCYLDENFIARFNATVGLPAKKLEIIHTLLAMLRNANGDVASIFFTGSFMHRDTFLDIDVMVVLPEDDKFQSYLQVDQCAGAKVEIFFETRTTLELRMDYERRNNMDALATLFEDAVELYGTVSRREAIDSVSQRIRTLPAKKISTTLAATYLHNGLTALERSNDHGDIAALAIDTLNIYRQFYHSIRNESTQASYKHFFRRIQRRDEQESRALLDSFARCLAGDKQAYIALMRGWMAANRLAPLQRLILKGQSVYALD